MLVGLNSAQYRLLLDVNELEVCSRQACGTGKAVHFIWLYYLVIGMADLVERRDVACGETSNHLDFLCCVFVVRRVSLTLKTPISKSRVGFDES